MAQNLEFFLKNNTNSVFQSLLQHKIKDFGPNPKSPQNEANYLGSLDSKKSARALKNCTNGAKLPYLVTQLTIICSVVPRWLKADRTRGGTSPSFTEISFEPV